LVITGSVKLFPKIKKFVDGENRFDCNKIIPIPKELDGTRSPSLIKTAEEIAEMKKQNEIDKKKWIKEHPGSKYEGFFSGEQAITQEQYDERIKKYGFSNWYDWAVQNWGTKWGTYDVGKWKNGKKSIEISFNSAWSPPLPVIKTLSDKFPSAVFTLEYADEGGGFLGSTTFEDGEVIGGEKLDWNSHAGIDMLKRLGRYCEEEEGDEEEMVK